MAIQTVFARTELKYLITKEQKNAILSALDSHVCQDQYGKTTIENLYLDTPSYLLIRRSIEKPVYKEKLRVRSYGTVEADGTAFVELKKKYKSTVYKRRVALPEQEAMAWLSGKTEKNKTQIEREIAHFLRFYGCLHPVAFISYDREAYFDKENASFRLTFDENILFRETDLSLRKSAYGEPLLADGTVLMEIKCDGGMPLNMAKLLSHHRIYKTSFSKYGTAYQRYILPKQKEKNHV